VKLYPIKKALNYYNIRGYSNPKAKFISLAGDDLQSVPEKQKE
jgi:non-homologous end joining protein Ku